MSGLLHENFDFCTNLNVYLCKVQAFGMKNALNIGDWTARLEITLCS